MPRLITKSYNPNSGTPGLRRFRCDTGLWSEVAPGPGCPGGGPKQGCIYTAVQLIEPGHPDYEYLAMRWSFSHQTGNPLLVLEGLPCILTAGSDLPRPNMEAGWPANRFTETY